MGGKILIVDDERSIRTAVRDALSRDGHFAVTASSAEEAIRRSKAEPFDLLITDLKMPGMSGLELIREIRIFLRDIRTILITAYVSTDSAIEALRLGVSDYMVKPFRLSQLRSTAARLLKELEGDREALSPETGGQREFEYRFTSSGDTLVVNGSTAGEGSEAACDAVRVAARAFAFYATKNGRSIDLTAAAEAISDMLYFERHTPVNLFCASTSGSRRACVSIGTVAAGLMPCSVASPGAGSFPGLRAAAGTGASPAEEPETKTAVLDDSRTQFACHDQPSHTRTISLESDNVDLKYLVEQIQVAARAAGLDPVRTNDIVAAINEAVLNSVEHAYGRKAAGRVDVACSVFDGEIVATVKDYGEGFDPRTTADGGGFAAFKRLADRAAIESAPGAGTTVYLAKTTH